MPLTQIFGGFERKSSRVTIALSNLPKVGHICVSEITPIPPRARVRFDSGMALVVDERMKWEKVD